MHNYNIIGPWCDLLGNNRENLVEIASDLILLFLYIFLR